jgi:Family of unknown function (DUF695)
VRRHFATKSNELTSSGDDSAQQWAIAKWDEGDHVYLSRWRKKLRVPDRTRPIKILVLFAYSQYREDGLPSAEELDSFEKIEATLIHEMASNDAALVLVLTGNFAREFIAYGSTVDWLQDWGPTVLSRWSDTHFGIEVSADFDPKWTEFRRFTK